MTWRDQTEHALLDRGGEDRVSWLSLHGERPHRLDPLGVDLLDRRLQRLLRMAPAPDLVLPQVVPDGEPEPGRVPRGDRVVGGHDDQLRLSGCGDLSGPLQGPARRFRPVGAEPGSGRSP